VAFTAIAISPLGFLLAFHSVFSRVLFSDASSGSERPSSVRLCSTVSPPGTFLPSCDRACHLDNLVPHHCGDVGQRFHASKRSRTTQRSERTIGAGHGAYLSSSLESPSVLFTHGLFCYHAAVCRSDSRFAISDDNLTENVDDTTLDDTV
jgi:hypothetical protein